MHRRRQSSLGRNTANAKRIRLIKENESPCEHEKRCEQERERHLSQKMRETSEECQSLLITDKAQCASEDQFEPKQRRSARLQEYQMRQIQQCVTASLQPFKTSVSSNIDCTVWAAKHNSALNYDANIEYKNNKSVNLGKMNNQCGFCSALKFNDESAGLCCQQGKIKLDTIETPPEPLMSLLSGHHSSSKKFMKYIRYYNNAFQMTSFGAEKIVKSGFMPTFKIQGQVYHLIGSILPLENEHQFLQMYFIDDYNAQANARCSNVNNLNQDLVRHLQDLLHENNRYVSSFKSTLESVPQNMSDFKIIIHADKTPSNQHERRYNEPMASEVALLMIDQEFGPRDIVLCKRDDTKQKVSSLHRSYDALQYPLMFCRGEDGYSIDIPKINPASGDQVQNSVSCREFYAYRMMVRYGEFNSILRYGRLTNQFWVDIYAKIEEERLSFIRRNQNKLRAENYIHLQDALRQDENPSDVGQLLILPSTFTAGPRYMHERTQDALGYVRKYGRPDLFITFTCNPKWEEITSNLYPNTTAQDRHDLISRVFHLKLKKLLFLINKAEIFGSCKCFMCTVEWQKRGLPHAHLLVWLQNKIRPDQIDNIIQAEIPDPNIDPNLHTIVIRHMCHGPCGHLNERSPCMKDGRCSKHYPKEFQQETSTADCGYPRYKRRPPAAFGILETINMKGNITNIDNRWIVPYNPVLLRVFDAHVNVEYCSSIKAIKYVCKYINKGSDQATFSLTSRDEVSQFQSGRYISSSEAVWRILRFNIHERSPAVKHLAVHLENGQRVYFTAGNAAEIAANPPNTTLTGFFKLCIQDPFARTLLYCDVPSYYRWVKNAFCRRKQSTPVDGYPGIRKSNVLGRVYSVHPSNTECFYLRLLLHKFRGPTSFDSLRTVDGVVYNTYQSACRALGLLEDDSHWDETLKEASVSRSASSVRTLFSIMLTFCQLSNPLSLWNSHRESMAEDILHHRQKNQNLPDLGYNDEIFNAALLDIEMQVQSLSGKSIKSMGLHLPDNANVILKVNESPLYNEQELKLLAARQENLLNVDQKLAYGSVLQSFREKSGKIFFLDAPGGTGKTFLLNLLLAKTRSEGFIAIAVASSGLASTLLDGGRTAHSMFKLPLNATSNDSAICNISKQSDTAKILQKCSLIVWDESTMSHKTSVETLDRTLKDLRNNNKLMGGVTVLFSGDFRQTLPVIPRGTRADELNACLKRSYIWFHVKKLSLTINMRSRLSGDENNSFANQLLKLGNGTIELHDGQISLNNSNLCLNVNNIEDLVKAVYPDISSLSHRPLTWLAERAILAPRNDAVESINDLILTKFDAESHTYMSVDVVMDEDEAVHYPTEFLNSINPPGIPSHKLILKVGAPIILLLNLNPPKLCKRTRLKIVKLNKHLIEAVVISGCGTGEKYMIPRIPLTSSDLPFTFKRLQFPVRLCFAMTINRAQGQTLKIAGINLNAPCFSHGQIYVAFSRVGSPNNVYVLAPNYKTKNIVYQEALA